MNDFDVLVVDDEPVVVDAARRVLLPEGLTVDAAGDGIAALGKLQRQSYGLILLDLMLPGVSGVELLATLVGEHPITPVIVTTGYASSRKGVEVLQAGAFDFLPKPFDVDELLGVVRRCLGFVGRWPALEGSRDTGQEERRRYFLGAHSWAALEEDGLATLGVAETFRGAIGRPSRIRLPDAGSEIAQGQRLARIEDAGACTHSVWSPLSGRVVGGNPRLETDPELVESSPFVTGWLTRIAPTNLQEELDELILR